MVEGSLWVYGHTRLADYYAGHISLRELANRLMALPAGAPIIGVLEDERDAFEAARRGADLDDVLNRYKTKG